MKTLNIFGVGCLLKLLRLMADSVREPENRELNSPLKIIEWVNGLDQDLDKHSERTVFRRKYSTSVSIFAKGMGSYV